uniref:Ig-like domain-containing protein n=1 Tax=Myripristis murdjan TaxID=586833 RepID=A0A667ZRM1_9TELE
SCCPSDFLFYPLDCLCTMLIWLPLKMSSSVHQESGFVSANVGDTVTLRCFYETDVAAMLYWYKQTIGQKPQLISTFYKFDKNGSFHDEFNNDPRFKLETENNGNHLTISDLKLSDSSNYYCAGRYSYVFEFADGVTLSVASPPVLVYFLSAALAFTLTLVVILASSVYKMHKRNLCMICKRASSKIVVEGHYADNLHYATLSENKVSRSRRQRDNTNTVCVYSSIKQ